MLPLLLLVARRRRRLVALAAVPGVDPAVALGRARPLFAAGFRLDDVQHRLVVRPVRALAGCAKPTDERVVDAAVEGTGTATTRLGGLLAAAHRVALPAGRGRRLRRRAAARRRRRLVRSRLMTGVHSTRPMAAARCHRWPCRRWARSWSALLPARLDRPARLVATVFAASPSC